MEVERGVRLFGRNPSLPLHLPSPFTQLGSRKGKGLSKGDRAWFSVPPQPPHGTDKSIWMEKPDAYDKTGVPSPAAHIGSWTGRSFASAMSCTDIQFWKQPPRSDPVPLCTTLLHRDEEMGTSWGASLYNKHLQSVLRTSSVEVFKDLLNRHFRGWR